MTVLDANVLLYAHDPKALQHADVLEWFDQKFDEGQSLGLSWPVIWAFVRVVTNHRVYPTPIPPGRAFEIVRSWFGDPRFRLIEPGPQHLKILEKLVIDAAAIGPKLSDAALAALAIEYGATLASTDRDFARFEELKWVNPLRPRR